MDYQLMYDINHLLLKAAWVTLKVSFWSFWLGLIVSSILVATRLSGILILVWLSRVYVSFIRGTPFFVQLLVMYYGTPAFGIELDAYNAGIIAIGFNIGAYMSEAMRGSILAVDHGQNEAARSLGFSGFSTFLYVVLPQAAGLMIRSVGVLTIIMIKGSSLVSIISVVELTYQAQRIIGSTYKPLEVFAVAAVLYLIIIYGVRYIIDRSYDHYTRYLH